MKSKFDWKEFSEDFAGIAVWVVLFIGAGFISDDIIESGCLQDYAEQYCSSINMTYDSWGGDSFWCLDNNYNLDDERLGNDKSMKFYFLSEEKEICNG